MSADSLPAKRPTATRDAAAQWTTALPALRAYAYQALRSRPATEFVLCAVWCACEEAGPGGHSLRAPSQVAEWFRAVRLEAASLAPRLPHLDAGDPEAAAGIGRADTVDADSTPLADVALGFSHADESLLVLTYLAKLSPLEILYVLSDPGGPRWTELDLIRRRDALTSRLAPDGPGPEGKPVGAAASAWVAEVYAVPEPWPPGGNPSRAANDRGAGRWWRLPALVLFSLGLAAVVRATLYPPPGLAAAQGWLEGDGMRADLMEERARAGRLEAELVQLRRSAAVQSAAPAAREGGQGASGSAAQ